MVSPIVACPGDTMDIVVKLKNFGLDTLNTATVNWAINGTSQTALNFVGPLLAGQDTNLSLGTYIFSSGTAYDLEFWSTNPNGIADLQTSNDSTVFLGFKTAIPAGTYTIGHGASADYSGIDTLIQDLNAYGICGPVVFEIDTGSYDAPIVLNSILGSSATNTITFRSANGDSSSVIVNWNPSVASGAVSLLNQSYVTIDGITFNVVGSTSNGKGVFLSGDAQHNVIKNCVFNQPTSTSSNVAGIYLNDADIQYNNFLNNAFTGGYYGAYVRGTSSTDRGFGNIVENNSFTDFYYYGIYAYYQDSLMLRGNTIINGATSVAYPRGIYAYYADNAVEYTGNIIKLDVSSYGYGIYSYYNLASSGARGLIANNMISIVGGTGTTYGIYLYNGQYMDVYYNSVNVNGSGTSSRCLYQSSGSSINLKNNIFKSNAFTMYISTPTAINSSDYNDLFTSGSTLAYWSGNRANLNALKSASSMDANSMSVDPNFISDFDLRLLTSPVDGQGNPISIVTTDFEGDLRDTLSPDMGADEFDPPAQDISLLSIENPAASNCGMTYESITVKAKNTGLDTIQGNLVLKYRVSGGTIVSESITTIIPPQDTITHTFTTQADFTTASDSTFMVKVWGDLPQDIIAFNDSAQLAVFNGVIPPSPAVVGVQSAYGTTATLTGTASGLIFWYDSMNATLPVGTGNSYTTPVLFDTTVFYCGALGTNGCVSLKVPDTVYVTGIPAGDLGISAIHVNQGCGLDSTETVTIDIYNQGIGTISTGVTAKFRINNNAWITPEIVTSSIGPGATVQHIFTAKANMFAPSDTMFDIEAEVILSSDPYLPNNSLLRDSVESFYTPAPPTVTSPLSIAYGAGTSLTAASPDTVFWFDNLIDTVNFAGGSPINVGPLYLTDTFYVAAVAGVSGNAAIGNGTIQNTNTTYPAPYGNWYWGSKDQYLILASELHALGYTGGDIGSVAFDVVTAQGTALTNFEIKMGHYCTIGHDY